jgi:hypothetical protein
MAVKMLRRDFIKVSCKNIVTLALILGACDDAVPVVAETPEEPLSPRDGLSLGTGDQSLLNLAFIQKQLQAAFYHTILNNPQLKNIFPEKKNIRKLESLKNQSVVHRELFRSIATDIQFNELIFDFSTIDANSQSAVLTHVKEMISLNIAGFTGFEGLFKDERMGTLIQAIIPVEKESMDSISTPDSGNRFEILPLKPINVLAKLQPFITQKLDGSGLPR